MQYRVLNKGLVDWVEVAQFLWKMDADDFVVTMVETRGYAPEKFKIEEIRS